MTDLRYPIGTFKFDGSSNEDERRHWIADIEDAPAQFRKALEGLAPEQVNTPYRPGGWTVRQVVHHVADSHMNAYIRFHLALTEDEPAVKPFPENLWAELADGRTAPVDLSLGLLEPLHQRWVFLLKSLSAKEWVERAFVHADLGRVTLEKNLALYSWHGRHHMAHITSLRDRMGWV
jgi:hypothetical protein